MRRNPKLLEGIGDTDMKLFKKFRNFKHLPQCSTNKEAQPKGSQSKNKKRSLFYTQSTKGFFFTTQ
jgi:hypothetical protein